MIDILSSQLEKITNIVFNKKGYYFTKIANNWNSIIGPELSDYSFPKKLVFDNSGESDVGKLHIEVKSSSIATELEYSKNLIIERISLFFGYAIINQIKLAVNPNIFRNDNFVIETEEDDVYKISPLKKEQLDYEISQISDEELRKSLLELGSLILCNVKV